MSALTELQAKLKDIFQINRADLDFGIYKILNQKTEQIDDYIIKQLPQTVQTAFSGSNSVQLDSLKTQLEQAVNQAKELGMPSESVPRVQELRAQIAALSQGSQSQETQVYNHLLTFFSRYYEAGDFISQRRYKGDTYAIPLY